MPQIFQVLRCYKCLTFQIHQTKKCNKFECKLCGEKQSIKRHYGIGTGKNCRLHVQKLNSLRGETELKSLSFNDSDEDELVDSQTSEKPPENISNCHNKTLKRSKWTEFIDTEEIADPRNNESMILEDNEVVLELPQKRKIRKVKTKTKSTHDSEYSNTLIHNPNIESEVREISVSNKTNNYESGNTVKHIQDHIIDNNNLETKDTELKCSNNNLNSPQKVDPLKTIPKTSKWAQFVQENDDENLELLNYKLSSENVCNGNNFFALCDDNNLDIVLDI